MRRPRESRHELPYEAMHQSGRASWSIGDRIRVFRTKSGGAAVIAQSDDEAIEATDRRDYDVDHYARLLRETFAIRLARAFSPADFEAVFADSEQMSLFSESVETVIRTVLVKEPENPVDARSIVSLDFASLIQTCTLPRNPSASAKSGRLKRLSRATTAYNEGSAKADSVRSTWRDIAFSARPTSLSVCMSTSRRTPSMFVSSSKRKRSEPSGG